jgi:hypothetical protein
MEQSRKIVFDYLTEPKPNSKVWRYMNYDKFIDLITNSELFFCRVDKLPDKHEGMLTPNIISEFYDRYMKIDDFYLSPMKAKQMGDHDKNHAEKYKGYTLINCWSQNMHESYALWKIYLGCQPYGVSIQTKYKNLVDSIIDNNYSYCFHNVYYANEPKDERVASVHYRKSKYYKFENEVRIGIFNQYLEYGGAPKFEKGAFIKIDLNKMIDKIYVTPFAPDFFYEFIYYVVKEKYKLKFPVVKSKIIEQNKRI